MKKLIRSGLILSLVGLAVLVAGLTLRSSLTAARGGEVEVESFAWGMSSGQYLRICMGTGASSSARFPREEVSFIYLTIKFETGDVILERSLTVPPGQFRCADITHPELVAAGLVPESNTRVQFLVNVGLNQTSTVGAAQRVTVGSAETITIAGGRTEIHKTIQTRQVTLIQDL